MRVGRLLTVRLRFSPPARGVLLPSLHPVRKVRCHPLFRAFGARLGPVVWPMALFGTFGHPPLLTSTQIRDQSALEAPRV
jgi:hypothetical protein